MSTPYKDAVLATSGLVSLWGLDEASGNSLDLKGSNNAVPHGTLTRAQASILPNGEGASALFDGSTAYFEIPNDASLNVGDVVTLEAWVKLTALGAYQMVLTLGEVDSADYRVGNSNTLDFEESGVGGIASSTTTLDKNAHHLAITKNGGTVKVYIDGVDVTGSVTSRTLSTSTSVKRIGMHTDDSQPLKGYMQSAAVYNVALDAATVKAHYDAGLRVDATVTAVPAVATASALPPTVSADATVTAVPAVATAVALPPSVSAVPPGLKVKVAGSWVDL